jgi:hypothetical protein
MAGRRWGDWRRVTVAVLTAVLILGLGFILRTAGLAAAANVAQLVALVLMIAGLVNWARPGPPVAGAGREPPAENLVTAAGARPVSSLRTRLGSPDVASAAGHEQPAGRRTDATGSKAAAYRSHGESPDSEGFSRLRGEPARPAGHVFISYVHEDSVQVGRMQDALEAAGLRVWRDRADLWPGEDWRAKIRDAIQNDALVFIACFSRQSTARVLSYQNEELVLAIEQLRRRRPRDPWLIPVRFDDCGIPDLDIGAGRTLSWIHHVDLYGDRSDEGLARLVAAVERILRPGDDAGAGAGGTPHTPGRDTSPQPRDTASAETSFPWSAGERLTKRSSGSPPRNRARKRLLPALPLPRLRVSLVAAAALAAVTALLVAALSPAPARQAAPSPPGAAAAPPVATGQPVNLVILADESASMQPSDVAGERRAAAEIVQEEWTTDSQIAIYGFGSKSKTPGVQPWPAVDGYCGPTELTGSTARARLTQCADEIRPRTEAQGNRSDYFAALSQALAVLDARQAVARLPLVFILTDGQLDVGPNPSYGPPTSIAGENAVAQQLITTQTLPALKSIGAQIWVLGIGQANAGELSLLAEGGAQGDCPAGSGSAPGAVMTSSPPDSGTIEAEVQFQLLRAFAEAQCAAIGQTVQVQLPEGGSVRKSVTISPLASAASLVIFKGDPRIVVTYTDPLGRVVARSGGPSAGSADGASFTLTSSSQSAQETLRLSNPPPGAWQVTFTDPPGVPAQAAGATELWQGSVDLQLAGQQVGDPGYPYQLTARLEGRSASLPASTLNGFSVTFEVEWPNGQVRNVPAHLGADGGFTATVTVPQNLSGTARVTATAVAPGVQGQAGTTFQIP